MTNIDRLCVAVAVSCAAIAAGEGAAMGARWMGAGEALAAVVYFVMVPLSACVFVGAIQEYRRHGWRVTR